MTISERIRQFIVTDFYVPDQTKLADSASFLDQGIIDSTGVLEVVAFLEREFGVTVEDAEIVPENFDSIQNLALFVDRKPGGGRVKLRELESQLRADYRRHGQSLKNPALWAVAVFRFGKWANEIENKVPRTLASKAYGMLFLGVEVTTGIVLNREAQVGKDFHLVHSGNTKIHPGVVIGDRCGIMHDVTLGTNMERQGVPRIGNDVFIGAGAKVLGPVTIGDGARIAANSLVLSDVPAGATAVGVPARVLNYTGRAPVAPAASNGNGTPLRAEGDPARPPGS